MQRYFINKNTIENNQFYLEKEDQNHALKVMRMKINQEIKVVIDKNTIFLAKLISLEGLFELVEQLYEDSENNFDLTLIYGLPKADKFELVVQKATELGVTRIIPLKSKRSIVKYDEKKDQKKQERWQKIAKEAAEQSHRLEIPEVLLPIENKDISDYLQELNLVCFEGDAFNESLGLDLHLKNHVDQIVIIVGPEGGFDDSEINYFESLGIKRCNLGKRILRSETAAIMAVGLVSHELNKKGV